MCSTADDLISYTLLLADNALIIGHRNSEWTGYGPVLEQDIALSNISLDLIGQARYFYQYAAKLINTAHKSDHVTEDTLAYCRDVLDFKNVLLVEQDNGDWAKTIVRQFFFSTFQFHLYGHLRNGSDPQLTGIAEKALKEVIYHMRWSSAWVIRLGDGTSESKTRTSRAVDDLWMFTGELFEPAPYETAASNSGIAISLDVIKGQWMTTVQQVFDSATLAVPTAPFLHMPWMGNGKRGIHTEHLGFLLAEMQFLPRSYPNCTW